MISVLRQPYEGCPDEAEKLHRQALAGRQQVLGPDHPDTLKSLNKLALMRYSKGDLEEEEKLFRHERYADTFEADGAALEDWPV